MKIENMSIGHSGVEEKEKEKKKIAIVSVASGEGISSLFSAMGVDCIVSGGQTANPSIEELLSAFKKCNAENIIVLPNNKNILLGANQAAAVYDEANVYVIPTQSLMQGYSALSVINPGITDIDALIDSATRAAGSVIDCEVTRAVRTVSIDGRKIEEGDYMAISNGRIVSVASTPEDALIDMLKSTDTDLCEVVSLFVGNGISDDKRVSLTEKIESEFSDLRLTVYIGGQEVYDYLLAVE
jgi:dihydroxyacetone kinase-like predicted kinase